jgi:ParB family transcriptional regulator, chromosome partitioning protein
VSAPAAPAGALLVAVSAIAPDPDQPRGTIAGPDLEALAASVRAHGVIQPLLVAPHPLPAARATTPFQIITGGRRWQAAQLAGLQAVPVVVREEPLSPSDRLMLQLDENDGELRRSLSLYDRARAIARAVALSGLTKTDFARRHHRSPAWCSHYLRLAAASGPLGDALREGFLASILGANLFDRLPAPQQHRLLALARRTGGPITVQQIEIAAQLRDAGAGTGVGGGLAAATAPPTAPSPAPAGDTAGPPAPALDPAAATRLSQPLTVQLTTPQLDTLLVRLGSQPHGSPDERVEQLYACLA